MDTVKRPFVGQEFFGSPHFHLLTGRSKHGETGLIKQDMAAVGVTIPDADKEIAKPDTLDRSDLDSIMRQNSASN